jgi:hypothetical protein
MPERAQMAQRIVRLLCIIGAETECFHDRRAGNETFARDHNGLAVAGRFGDERDLGGLSGPHQQRRDT